MNRISHSKKTLLSTLESMAAAGDKDAISLIADYKNGLISIQDGTIRSIAQANAVTELALFEPTSEKRDGIYTLSKSQLDKGIAFIVTGIALMATQVLDSNGAGGFNPRPMGIRSPEEFAAMLEADSFSSVANFPAIANGEVSIRVNRKPVLDKLAASVFMNGTGVGGVTEGPLGYYKLDNPIFIKPEVPIEATLRLPVATPASTLVEIVFYGAQTLAT